MNENTETGSPHIGRTLRVLAFGDTADEIEMAALDEAREFFGPDLQLRTGRDWGSFPNTTPAQKESGKKYHATVIVRTVEPD